MEKTLHFAAKLARDTGQKLLEFYSNPNTQSNLKDDHTIVTEADLSADAQIASAIHAHFPDDHILSEEHDTTYPGHTTPVWVVDPLDGTGNFSLGVHYWGVSIARIINGRPEVAALYFPFFDELYTARRGGGAQLNGQILKIEEGKRNHLISFFTCDSRMYRHYKVGIRYKVRILGSAAYNFCAIARGISVVGFETTPKIWDIAASWLVLKEAGGAIHPFEQSPFPLIPNKDYKGISFPVLGAINQELLNRSREKITKK